MCWLISTIFGAAYTEITGYTKIINLPTSPTKRCCTTLKKNNYYWAFQTIFPFVVCGGSEKSQFFMLRWGHRLVNGPLLQTLAVTTISSHTDSQGFIFYQDGAPAHMVCVTQDWLQANCHEFIEDNHWPPFSPDLNPLDYHVWSAMREKYHKLQLKPKKIDELKVALQTIWNELWQEHINKEMANFTKCLTAWNVLTTAPPSHHLAESRLPKGRHLLKICIRIVGQTELPVVK